MGHFMAVGSRCKLALSSQELILRMKCQNFSSCCEDGRPMAEIYPALGLPLETSARILALSWSTGPVQFDRLQMYSASASNADNHPHSTTQQSVPYYKATSKYLMQSKQSQSQQSMILEVKYGTERHSLTMLRSAAVEEPPPPHLNLDIPRPLLGSNSHKGWNSRLSFYFILLPARVLRSAVIGCL